MMRRLLAVGVVVLALSGCREGDSPETGTTQVPEPVTTVVPYYSNCQDMKDAGMAPVKRGEDGYREALDRDHDGVACDS